MPYLKVHAKKLSHILYICANTNVLTFSFLHRQHTCTHALNFTLCWLLFISFTSILLHIHLCICSCSIVLYARLSSSTLSWSFGHVKARLTLSPLLFVSFCLFRSVSRAPDRCDEKGTSTGVRLYQRSPVCKEI